ncbi:MFS transporter [Rhodococcus sp. WS4]|nr:MFS transporter [Rhodococcus sp. WS4]
MASPAAERKRLPWVITGLLVVFVIINWADKAVFGIAAQSLKEDLGLSSSTIGFIGSAFFFLFTVTGIVVGFIANRISTKWILFVLAIAWTLTQVPVLLAASATTLLVSRIALGAAEGPATSMATAATFEWFKKERQGLPAALINSGASIAKIAIAPILAVIVVNWGWRAAFLTLALAGLVWAAAWLLIGRQGPYAQHRSRQATPETSDEQSAAAIGASDNFAVPFWRIALTPSYLGAVLGTFAVYGLVTVVLTWLPSYFEEGLGYSRVAAGSMFGLPSVAALMVMITVTTITDRRMRAGAGSRAARVWVTAAAMIVGGGLLIALPWIELPTVAVVAVSVGYGFAVLVLPMMSTVVSEICPPNQRAGALGLFIALQGVAGLIAPAVTGALVDSAVTPADGYSQSFQIFGAVVLVGAVVVTLLVHPERDRLRLTRVSA